MESAVKLTTGYHHSSVTDHRLSLLMVLYLIAAMLHPESRKAVCSVLQQRRQQARLCMMHKILHDDVDIDKAAYFTPASRRTRNSNSCSLQRPSTSTNIHKFAFFPRTIAEWNHLPDSTVTRPHLMSFRQAITGEKVIYAIFFYLIQKTK